MKNIVLKSFDKAEFDLTDFISKNDCVLIIYPKMGENAKGLSEDFKAQNCLTGCTPQNRAYEALKEQFESLNFKLIAISAQSTSEQAHFREQIGASYLFLNDENFALEKEFGLKTFFAPNGKKFYFRQTIIIKNGKIALNKLVKDALNDASQTLKEIKEL